MHPTMCRERSDLVDAQSDASNLYARRATELVVGILGVSSADPELAFGN